MADGYLSLDGAGWLDSPDHADFEIGSSDWSIRIEAAMDDWTPAAIQSLFAKNLATGNQRSWTFQMRGTSTGIPRFGTTNAGGSGITYADPNDLPGFADGSRHWLRADRRRSDGRVQVFKSDDGTNWTQIGSDGTGQVADVANTTALPTIGATSSGTDPMSGKVYKVVIYSDLTETTLKANVNLTANTGGTTYTDPQSHVWTARGTASLVAQTLEITPSGVSSGEAVGSPTVISVATIAPAGVATGEALGSPAVSTNAAVISPAGIRSAEVVGSLVVSPGAVVVSPAGRPTTETFGAASVLPGAVSISPSGITSSAAFGVSTIFNSLFIFPTGIASAEAFGTDTVVPGGVSVSPSGIATAEALGASVVKATNLVVVSGIASAQAFGAPAVLPGAVLLSPAGIASAEALGAVTFINRQLVLPAGIASAEALGAFGILRGAVVVSPVGIGSQQAVGVAVVTPGSVLVLPTGIASVNAFGTAVITVQDRGAFYVVSTVEEAMQILSFVTEADSSVTKVS